MSLARGWPTLEPLRAAPCPEECDEEEGLLALSNCHPIAPHCCCSADVILSRALAGYLVSRGSITRHTSADQAPDHAPHPQDAALVRLAVNACEHRCYRARLPCSHARIANVLQSPGQSAALPGGRSFPHWSFTRSVPLPGGRSFPHWSFTRSVPAESGLGSSGAGHLNKVTCTQVAGAAQAGPRVPRRGLHAG